MEKTDQRLGQIRVLIADGEASGMEAACDWMLGVLSGGVIGRYIGDVLRRAAATDQNAPDAEGGPLYGRADSGKGALMDAAV